MSFIYVASPYYDSSEEIREMRFLQVEAFTAGLLTKGIWAYSPIVHCHELAIKYELPKEFAFWHNYNFSILAHASMLLVLRLDGWNDSQGVASECSLAKALTIPIEFADFVPTNPENMEVDPLASPIILP